VWNAEEEGRTWEGFCRLIWVRLLRRRTGERIIELAAGDGLVGSLGRWLEQHQGWKAECWEAGKIPRQYFSRFRPVAILHAATAAVEFSSRPAVVFSRSARMNTLLRMEMERSGWNPTVVGLWNKSGRGLWARRMRRLGYRLGLCRDRLEVYQRKERSGACSR